MSDLLLRMSAGILLLGMFAVSGYFRRQADRRRGRVSPPSREVGYLIVLRLGLLVGVVVVIFNLVWPSVVEWARVDLHPALRLAGLVVMVACAPLLIWMFRALGPNITSITQTRSEHALVESGPYRWIRHPLYSFGAMFWTSLAIALQNWLVFVLFWSVFFLLHARTRIEEGALVERYGDVYRDYMRRTGRYLPKLR